MVWYGGVMMEPSLVVDGEIPRSLTWVMRPCRSDGSNELSPRDASITILIDSVKQYLPTSWGVVV